MKNSSGSHSGPPAESDEDDGSDIDGNDESEDVIDEDKDLDIRPDSLGWEDMEPDTESLLVVCLLCLQTFGSAQVMLEHCTLAHNFDFLADVKQMHLDSYTTMKYINLIRQNVRNGSDVLTQRAGAWMEDERLLRPTLEDDAFLFTLDEVIDFSQEGGEGGNGMANGEMGKMRRWWTGSRRGPDGMVWTCCEERDLHWDQRMTVFDQ